MQLGSLSIRTALVIALQLVSITSGRIQLYMQMLATRSSSTLITNLATNPPVFISMVCIKLGRTTKMVLRRSYNVPSHQGRLTSTSLLFVINAVILCTRLTRVVDQPTRFLLVSFTLWWSNSWWPSRSYHCLWSQRSLCEWLPQWIHSSHHRLVHQASQWEDGSHPILSWVGDLEDTPVYPS